jgi:xanthine dehydrogenase small subunit
MPHNVIRFVRRGQVVEVKPSSPMQTVLDYLRLEEKSKGTKEGCNEGDCGACTIVLGKLHNDRVVYEPANACILMMGHLQGRELITVDDLARDGVLHPVQQAMVDTHGTQCGFCTPGFIMSLFALHHAGVKPDRQMIVEQLAGNLCRCTGYRPIIAAAEWSCDGSALDHWAANGAQTARTLSMLRDGVDVLIGNKDEFLAIPASAASLCELAAKQTDATIVAGATDVGLWITKQLRDLPKVIHLGNVAELHLISDRMSTLSIGAAATYAEAEVALCAIAPDVQNVLRRIGSKQVRASGTVGGNIANGSPIGDMAPMLIALGARLVLRHGEKQRDIALEKFFIDYGKQDRKPGELVWRIDIPKLKDSEHFFAHKISKRSDQDISAVLAAFHFTITGRKIVACRLAYGGMAGTPKRAAKAEAAITGLNLETPHSWAKAVAALEKDFTPLSDMRASAAYRMDTAKALLLKALFELVGEKSQSLRLNIVDEVRA